MEVFQAGFARCRDLYAGARGFIKWRKALAYGIALLWLSTGGVALALLGGGVTPIGIPEMQAVLGEADCANRKWNGFEHFQRLGAPVLKFGGAAYNEHLWGSTDPAVTVKDFAAAYSDDTGVFWDLALYDSAPVTTCGVSAESQLQQTFTKDVDTAWVAFTISSVYLFADRSGAWQNSNNSGGRADVWMEGHLQTEVDGWTDHLQFDMAASLATEAGGVWRDPAFKSVSDPPMTYVQTRDETDIKEVTYDRYTGTLDISAVPVGGAFTVHFISHASAQGGHVAEGPMHMQAYIRDPLSTGGGVSLSADGVTPLNKSMSTPVPRDRAQAQVIQADGKIVAVGQAFVNGNYDFALARYNSDGSLDASFGTGGKVTTDIGGNSDMANAVAIQRDGKIVVAGTAGGTPSASSSPRPTSGTGSNVDFALVRYDSDGTLDASFGPAGTGKVVLDFAAVDDVAEAVAIQRDGKIVVAGYTGNTNVDFALARFNADGTLDTSFGILGRAIADYSGAGDYAYAVALQSDGRIVVAGRSDSAGATKTDFALARYDTDGTLDTSFGTSGKLTTDFASSADSAQALAVQGDGKIVAVGWAFNGADNDMALVRYNGDGSLDNGCGNVLRDLSGTHDEASAVVIQNDGKIVVGGNTLVGAQRDFALARFDSTCAVDTSFGANGLVTGDFAGEDDRIAALALQSDGKIVATGYAVTATGEDFAMLRVNP